MAQPMKSELSEKEKAQAKREKLEKMARGAQDQDSEDGGNLTKSDFLNKRKEKMQEKMSKRDQAVEKELDHQSKR
jgi:hypothetical protein